MRAGARPDRANRKGTLLVIGLLFVASALLRAGGGVSRAMAQGETAPAPAAASCPDAAEIDAVLARLRDREADLGAREDRIALREHDLALAKAAIDTRLSELAAAEKRLAETVEVADAAAESDVTRLVAVYEAMKPKEAARLFEEMDPAFAAGFLGRMRPEAAAAVLAGIAPQRGYAISARLAGRNADAPLE